MKEEITKEQLLQEAIPPDIQDREGVIRYMVDNRFVSNTLLQDLKIMYLYKQERRSESSRGAAMNISVKFGLSERTVYRARKRIGNRRIQKFKR